MSVLKPGITELVGVYHKKQLCPESLLLHQATSHSDGSIMAETYTYRKTAYTVLPFRRKRIWIFVSSPSSENPEWFYSDQFVISEQFFKNIQSISLIWGPCVAVLSTNISMVSLTTVAPNSSFTTTFWVL